MKVTVNTQDLAPGMFVAELDRPWLETPFLLQGFLIEDQVQVEQLRRYCREVIVDRGRSVGEHYACAKRVAEPLRLAPAMPVFREAEDAGPNDFPAICRMLREHKAGGRFRKAPQVLSQDGQSRLEAEIVYSAPVVADVHDLLLEIDKSVVEGGRPNINQVRPLVQEMAQGVERNPEAMLWLSRLKTTNQYSYDHALDVSVHLMVFGKSLGLPAQALETLGLAGLMQDVGKVEVPPDLLNKPGRLSPDEYALMQAHVATSLDILIGSTGFPMEVLSIVAGHHERSDGSGYPRRLKGEKIGLHAELAGLVDSYCAMIRERPHVAAISSQQALEELIKQRGSKFREVLVDQFIQCIGLYPIGSLVELNTGEVAVVLQQNQVRRLKPRVLVILAPDKSLEHHPRTLDLIMEPTTPDGGTYAIVRALPPDAYGIDPAELYLS